MGWHVSKMDFDGTTVDLKSRAVGNTGLDLGGWGTTKICLAPSESYEYSSYKNHTGQNV